MEIFKNICFVNLNNNKKIFILNWQLLSWKNKHKKGLKITLKEYVPIDLSPVSLGASTFTHFEPKKGLNSIKP